MTDRKPTRRRTATLADGSMAEHVWQRKVEGVARFYGWRVFHAPDNKPMATNRGRAGRQRITPGFPDLMLLRGPVIIFAELKADKGRIDPEQHAWLDALGVVGGAISNLALEAYGDARLEGFGPPLPELPAVHAFVWRPRDVEVVNLTLGHGRPLAAVAEIIGGVA